MRMSTELPATERVRQALLEQGVEPHIAEFPQGTRTAEQAAEAIGVEVGQIVKSLIFMAGDEPVLALVSGSNMADTNKLGELLDSNIGRADARRVREATGFAIGGVPPLGHATSLPTFIDEDLLRYETVHAAAGTPFTVFAVEPEDLVRMTGGKVADIAQK